jgi:sec-independent protein translocase protein TatA
MFGGLGMGEMVLIFLVVLLLFGAKRIPEIGTSLGSGIREFKKSMKDVEREALRPAEPRYVPPPLPETPAFAARNELPAAQITAAVQTPATPQA